MIATRNRGPAAAEGRYRARSEAPSVSQSAATCAAAETAKKGVAGWFKTAGIRDTVPELCLERIALCANATLRWLADIRAAGPDRAQQDEYLKDVQRLVAQFAVALPKLLDSFGRLPSYDITPKRQATIAAFQAPLNGVAEALGEPQQGRPAEAWELFAPYLLGPHQRPRGRRQRRGVVRDRRGQGALRRSQHHRRQGAPRRHRGPDHPAIAGQTLDPAD